MAHSDDAGLVLPPAVAPIHVVIVPIYKTPDELDAIDAYLAPELDKLRKESFSMISTFANIDTPLSIKIDSDDFKLELVSKAVQKISARIEDPNYSKIINENLLLT